jgi:gliding motility-associated-like protein
MNKIILAISFFCGFSSHAQLIIDNSTQTPAQIVINNLVGAGVTPFNIKFNGSTANAALVSGQIARFDTNFNPTNLGLSNGVALTTGSAQVAIGPNNQVGASINVPNALSEDVDLDLITTNSVEHVSIIEFDFVATGTSLNFDFVFASEEYPEYSTDPMFNDVFGFFLSGPGIAGPYSNGAKNIALIPSTTIPISIATVNNGFNNNGSPCTNCAFYYNNTNIGIPQVPAWTGFTVQYDGFTKPIRASSDLVCGGTYHIKLAIGNVGDNDFDSAVFLKNFSIAPLQLVDDLGLDVNLDNCFGQTVNINSGLTVGSNIFTWKKDGVIIAGQSGASLSVTVGGTYSLQVTTIGGCIVAQDDILIGYRAPFPTNNPLDINQCSILPPPYTYNINQTSYILGTQSPLDYIISYYDSSYQNAFDGIPTGLIPAGSLSSYNVTSVPKTIWIRIEETGGAGCVTVKPVVLNSITGPSGTIAYAASSYCAITATPQLMTGTITPGGVYSATPAGLSINATTGAINPSLSTAGTYAINYNLAASGGCPAYSSGSVNVTISPAVLAPTVTTPAPYCQNTTATALTATGTALLWYTAATGGVGNPTAPVPSTVTAGTTSYYVSQTVSGCEGPRASIVVTVIPTPAAPVFTAPAPYCQNATATALTATGTALLWYTAATGGVGSATAPTPITTAAGTTTYYVSQTVSGCEGPRAAIAVVVNATPALPSFTPVAPYCQNATATALTATGSSLLWYANATGGTGSVTAPVPNTTAVGTINYYVSQTLLGCEGPRVAIPVTVTATPLAPTVTTPAPYCQNTTAAALTATGTALLWYTAATGGVGNPTAPVPSTVTAGTTSYYVSQTVSGCEGPRATIPVVVNATPLQPTFTAPAPYCQNATATALNATGTNLLWYAALTGGVGSATAPIPTTTIAGTINYYVSQTILGCEGPRATIPVVVNATPLQPTFTAPAPYCQNATATALTATGSNLLWYTSLTGGVGNAIAPIPSTVAIGTINYYVSQTILGCEGPRSTIPVVVNATPLQPTFTAPAPYCQNAPATALTATGTNLLWYTALTGGVGNATAPTPSTATAGTTTYYVSQTIGCESPRAAINVIVNPTPSLPEVDPVHYCINDTANPLSAIGTNLLWYTIATAGVGSATAPTPTTVATGTTTYYVTQTINGCEGPRASIAVLISEQPASLSLVTSNYFSELQSVTVTVLPSGNYEYQLDNGPFQTTNVFTNVDSGEHTVTVRNECGELEDVFTIIDYPKFFTPNGDGYHDTWNIFALSDQPNAKIYIFDRLGKLIKEIRASGEGWNGTFNGVELPSTDYWFTIQYLEDNQNKEFKSHFALKR